MLPLGRPSMLPSGVRLASDCYSASMAGALQKVFMASSTPPAPAPPASSPPPSPRPGPAETAASSDTTASSLPPTPSANPAHQLSSTHTGLPSAPARCATAVSTVMTRSSWSRRRPDPRSRAGRVPDPAPAPPAVTAPAPDCARLSGHCKIRSPACWSTGSKLLQRTGALAIVAIRRAARPHHPHLGLGRRRQMWQSRRILASAQGRHVNIRHLGGNGRRRRAKYLRQTQQRRIGVKLSHM